MEKNVFAMESCIRSAGLLAFLVALCDYDKSSLLDVMSFLLHTTEDGAPQKSKT